MKYLVKKGNQYLNYHNESEKKFEFYWDSIEYAWGFDSIESAQKWASMSGGTVVLPLAWL